MDNNARRILHKMKYKKQLDQLMGLVKKSVIVSQKYAIYEVDINFTCSVYFEFRFYRKEETEEILLWETIGLDKYDFDEKYTELNRVLNHLLQYGVMPDIYNFYINKHDGD
jgi:hypothetical protein